ncbi:hypothetical protein Vi05172_g12040 [Venturia inaequalis]|nr:hypothetical protein Vi05172_g12040 [Venturia inaequalis]
MTTDHALEETRSNLGGVTRKMARDVVTGIRQVYNHSHMPTSSRTTQTYMPPGAAAVVPTPVHATGPTFSRDYTFKIVKGTAKLAARSVTNVTSMVGRNPKLTLAALGLMLVGQQWYKGRRLQPYGRRLRRDRNAQTTGQRKRARNIQKSIKIQQSETIEMINPSGAETKTGPMTRHMVVDVGSNQVRLTVPSSLNRGAGEVSTLPSYNRNPKPDPEMDDSDSSAPEKNEEQEQRRTELRERFARYTGRMSRREATLIKRRDDWLEADETLQKAQEVLSQSQEVLDQAQRAFHQSREDLARAESKLEKAAGSRDLVGEQIKDVERQQEDLEREVYME